MSNINRKKKHVPTTTTENDPTITNYCVFFFLPSIIIFILFLLLRSIGAIDLFAFYVVTLFIQKSTSEYVSYSSKATNFIPIFNISICSKIFFIALLLFFLSLDEFICYTKKPNSDSTAVRLSGKILCMSKSTDQPS